MTWRSARNASRQSGSAAAMYSSTVTALSCTRCPFGAPRPVVRKPYSDVRPAGFDASEDRPGAARAEIGAITTDIRNARRRGETVVVYFHWGTERAQIPDVRQRTSRQRRSTPARRSFSARTHMFSSRSSSADAASSPGASATSSSPHILQRPARPASSPPASTPAASAGATSYPRPSPASAPSSRRSGNGKHCGISRWIPSRAARRRSPTRCLRRTS